MENYYPNYSPSIIFPEWCQTASAEYKITWRRGDDVISKVRVYLQLKVIGSRGFFKPYVSLNEMTFSSEEWQKYFGEHHAMEAVRSFFNEPTVLKAGELTRDRMFAVFSTRISPSIYDDDEALSSTEPQLFITGEEEDRKKSIVINRADWRNIELVLSCVNRHVERVLHIKTAYDNRFIYFGRQLKLKRPSSIEEACAIIDGIHDPTSIVDCELKYLALNQLFIMSYLCDNALY